MSAQPTGAKPNPAASSKVPAAKKPITKAVMPKELRTDRARLSFKSADSKEWVVLPCFGKIQKRNVGPVVFNGDIAITQKTGGNRCIFKLQKEDHQLADHRFVLGSAENDEERMFVGHFSLIRPGACRIDTDKDDDESKALAATSPLATVSSTFKEIRLVVDSDATDWKQDVGAVTTKPEVLRGQLAQLCTGQSSAKPKSNPTKISQTNLKAPPDLVTIPESEKLKTFAQKAEERRKAAKAAVEAEVAAMDARHAAEKAKLEQEHAERRRLLEVEIAAEEEMLRSEAQLEERS